MRRVLFLFALLVLTTINVQAAQKIGVISDSMLTETNPYNAYSKTPSFLVQDISDGLKSFRAFEVIPYSETYDKLIKNGVNTNYIKNLRNIQYGYELDFKFLKQVSNALNTDKIVIVTSTIERERDFLKNTFWNVANIGGFDTVNPTQRVNIYVVLVDTASERILWEELYAKNIRNNKFKNLDTSVSGGPEGMMRLKQYSKYVSKEISENVTLALAPAYAKPEVYINKFEETAVIVNKKIRLGSNKKLRTDNEVLHKTFVIQQDLTDKTKEKTKEGIENIKDFADKTKTKTQESTAVLKSKFPPAVESEKSPSKSIEVDKL